MIESININSQKIKINEKYTIVLGKIEETEILKYKDDVIDQINLVLSEIESIEIVNFIKIFQTKLNDFSKYKDGFKILEKLHKVQSIMDGNSSSLIKFIKLIEKLNTYLNYFELKQKKTTLSNDLKLSKIKHKSNTISAKTDLLEKLNQAIEKNKKNLEYLKEDYYKYKNQVDQINKKIEEKNKNIQLLNKKKKQSFRQINNITREMEGKKQKEGSKGDLGLLIDDDLSLSKSERILALQKQARECQYEIKNIRKEINSLRNKLEGILPKYEKLEKDFNNLSKEIGRDKERKKEIQKEINEMLHENKDLEDINIEDIDVAKSPDQIKNEIASITKKIEQLETQYDLFQEKSKNNVLISIKNGFKKLADSLSEQSIITPELIETAIKEIGKIRTLHHYLLELETQINLFVKEIDLVCNFKIQIDKSQQNFIVHPHFIRKGKENIEFDGLTTPEKVFFGICFYLSCLLLLDQKEIVFSNLFIPSNFNKRGSLFRTIRKILPIFKEKSTLSDYTLIFIISKLNLKRQIKNAKIIHLVNKNK